MAERNKETKTNNDKDSTKNNDNTINPSFLLNQNKINALQQIKTMADRMDDRIKETKKSDDDKTNDNITNNDNNNSPNPSFLFIQNKINALQQNQINTLQQQTVALQQKVDALEKENTALRDQVDEINSYFCLRVLVTRLDRVIVKDLKAFVGPNLQDLDKLFMMGETNIGGMLKLTTLLDESNPNLQASMLPPDMKLETFRSIGGVLWALKRMHADTLVYQRRIFDDKKLHVLMNQVFRHVDVSLPNPMNKYGQFLLEWIHNHYGDYLKTGDEHALQSGERTPFDVFGDLE